MELTLSLGCNNTFHEQSPIQMATKIDMSEDQFSTGDDIGRFIRSKLDNTTSNHNQPLQILLLPNNPDNKLPSSFNSSPGRITTTIKRKRSSDIMMESDLFETTVTLDRRSSGCTGTTTTSTDDEGHQENMNMAAAMISCNKKLRLSREQSAFLEDSFKEQSNLNPKQKLALAKQLNLRPRQVEVWFQNRRARTKLKQTEVECDYLKRRCESLTEENKRLQKEVMELRALKATSIHPFFSNMQQQPPTTLTLCPSCHRSPPASRAPENAS